MANLYNLARCFVGNTPGFGNVTVGVRVPPWISFSDAGVASGAISYGVEDYQIGVTGRIPVASETGMAIYNSSTGVISGRTVDNSSNGNAPINISSSAEVYITPRAQDFVGQVVENANLIYAGPASGGAALPTFRALVATDIPGSAIKLTVHTTPVSGATAGQILYSDGTTLQATLTLSATSLALGGSAIGGNALAVTGSSALSATTATTIAVGGATIGGNSLAVTGTGIISGNLTGSSNINCGAASSLGWTGRSQIISPTDGQIVLQNNAGTDFTYLKWGGGTSSFPAIRRASAALNIVLADGSADADVTAGNITASGNVGSGASQLLYFSGRSILAAPSDGVIRLTNNAQTDFTRLQFGGTTNSFPAIKRNGVAFNFRLADDSADASIAALAGNFSGSVSAGINTAITAGGSGVGLYLSSTSGFGVIGGSGAPTLSAAQGSLYLRSDGAPYYNNNGTTGWTSMAAGSGTVTQIIASTGLTGGTITTTGTIALDLTRANTWTGAPTLSGVPLIMSGAITATAWTTSGVRLKLAAASYTDSSSSGTVASAYTDFHGAGTILASSATTYTNYFGDYFQDPVASTNVTMTNKWSIGVDSFLAGTSNSFKVSTAGTVTIGAALTYGGVTLSNSVSGTGSMALTAGTTFTGTTTTATLVATTLNGNTFTTGTYTLTGTAGKTLTFSNTLTLAGTDSTTMTFPGTSSTVLTTGNTATLTVGFTFTANNIGTVSSGTTTPAPASGNYQYLTNNGAFTLAAPSSDCAIDILVTNGASAGAITFSGFTVGSTTGSALTTTNTNKFIISIRRINSISTYSIYALQ